MLKLKKVTKQKAIGLNEFVDISDWFFLKSKLISLFSFLKQMANKAAFKLRTQALKKTRANKVTRIQHED